MNNLSKVNSLYLHNIKEVNKLKPSTLNCNDFSVYDYNAYTLQELVSKLGMKINEIIELSNTNIDLTEWLVNEGLEMEVAIKLETWLNEGKLDEIINGSVFNGINSKFTIDPDSFKGTDVEKIQKAFDFAIENGYQEIKLFREYNLTGGTVFINKTGEFPRKPIRIKSFNGGFIKNDEGFMFSSRSTDVGDLFISNCKFTSISGSNTKVYDCSKIIRINSCNNYYSNIDFVFYEDNRYIQSVRTINDYFTYVRCVFKFRYAWDLHAIGCLCEESYKFIEDDMIERHYISNNISITDCVIENTKDVAIKINGCHALNISNNYFEYNVGNIILGQYGGRGCKVEGNFFFDDSQGERKYCVKIEGGDGINYSFISNYIGGNLELVKSNLNRIVINDISNYLNDNAIVSSNSNIVKSYKESTERNNNVVVKENIGIKQINYKVDYFELTNGQEKIIDIPNIYDAKVDDIVSVQSNNLGNDVFVSTPKITNDNITFKVKNMGSETNGCHIHLNILKINKVSGY